LRANSGMRSVAAGLLASLLKFGGLGLLVIGVADSSFLFAPWGNDLLVIAMTTRHPSVVRMLYYAFMSAAGSVLGCLLIDLTIRPLGAKGLEKYLSVRRLKHVQRKVRENADKALAVASLAPPPFPFTPFIMGAAALQYSRGRLVAVVGITRAVRFTLLGALALRFGSHILRWARNPIVQAFLISLTIFCTVGSAVSVYGWIKRGRSAPVGQKALTK
jgi:membrane protein YqaA with SNARE-associated domain